MTETLTLEAAIANFCAAMNARLAAHFAEQGYRQTPSTFNVDKADAPKWIRIVNDHSAFAFVERATGDLYKPAGYKGPAKNFARGNVYQPESYKHAGPYSLGK